MMTKLVTRTDDVAGFFSRAEEAARRADRGEAFEGRVTLSFEDPQRMFTVFSEARRRLMLKVMREPRTISELSQRLHRNRSTVTKDVGLLEKAGCWFHNARPTPQGTAFKKSCARSARKSSWWRHWVERNVRMA